MNFRYDGTQTLVFPSIKKTDGTTLKAVPGEVYDLRETPTDSRFTQVKIDTSAPQSSDITTTPPVVEPASAPTTETSTAAESAVVGISETSNETPEQEN